MGGAQSKPSNCESIIQDFRQQMSSQKLDLESKISQLERQLKAKDFQLQNLSDKIKEKSDLKIKEKEKFDRGMILSDSEWNNLKPILTNKEILSYEPVWHESYQGIWRTWKKID